LHPGWPSASSWKDFLSESDRLEEAGSKCGAAWHAGGNDYPPISFCSPTIPVCQLSFRSVWAKKGRPKPEITTRNIKIPSLKPQTTTRNLKIRVLMFKKDASGGQREGVASRMGLPSRTNDSFALFTGKRAASPQLPPVSNGKIFSTDADRTKVSGSKLLAGASRHGTACSPVCETEQF
jgi:hypothetical protein